MAPVRTLTTMSDGDIAHVAALLQATALADGRFPLSDHLHLDLINGGGDGFRAVMVTPEHDDDTTDDLIAYGQVSRGNETDTFELVVHPDQRHRLADLGRAVLGEAIAEIRDSGGGTINWWVFEPTDTHRLIATDAGLQPGRVLYQMRRSLPTGRDVTIDTRPFVPGADEAAWLHVNNRAFAGHGEQGGWTLDTLHLREQEDWFDPDGFLVHDVDGRMAAFCWTKVHPESAGEPPLGEIYVIAVDPDFHGRGLGTQMTLAGLDHLAGQGIGIGLLYVDADNTAAVSMYEHLGFQVHATSAAFEATIAPAR